MAAIVAIPGRLHAELQQHLLPPDGKEAAAIILCGRAGTQRLRLVAHSLILIPHEQCRSREPDYIVWPGEFLAEAIAIAEDEDLSIILAHSHPGGLFDFSLIDDESDRQTIPAIRQGWCGRRTSPPHGSAIMVPGGAMRARLYVGDDPEACAWVECIGDDLPRWYADARPDASAMAFSDAMRGELARRRACVIGVSGTGSVVAEQVARMGFGGVVLIDFDRIEPKNLNRILNSTRADAGQARLKVEVFAAAIRSYRDNIEIVSIAESILSRGAVKAAADCDVLFSCVDSSEGRQIADLMAQAFGLPLIDMGVTIPTRRLGNGQPAIAEAMGRIDYVQPGGTTLWDRGVYTPESLRAEYLARAAPSAFEAERNEGYIRGAPQEAPAVISLNMRAASAAVIEYLARAFPFRHDPNRLFTRTIFRLAEGGEEYQSEDEFEMDDLGLLGIGEREPLLGLPALGEIT